MGLDELSQTPSIINNDDGGIQNVLCALYPSLERFPEMNLCNVAFLFLLIKLRLHCIHQVILDFPLFPSVCLSLTPSPYCFQFISKSYWLVLSKCFRIYPLLILSTLPILVVLCPPPAQTITAASSLVLTPTLVCLPHTEITSPSIQEPLMTPISLRIKSKPLPCFTEPFEGWPSRSSNLISLFTLLPSTKWPYYCPFNKPLPVYICQGF